MPENREPVYSAGTAGSVITGASFLVLQEPIQTIFIELGMNDKLSRAIVTVLMVALPFVVNYFTSRWARNRVVTLAVANDKIEQAFDMPANSPQSKLEELKIGTEAETKKEK